MYTCILFGLIHTTMFFKKKKKEILIKYKYTHTNTHIYCGILEYCALKKRNKKHDNTKCSPLVAQMSTLPGLTIFNFSDRTG